jgi:drug/metabolite transporter (DMT)-like permease
VWPKHQLDAPNRILGERLRASQWAGLALSFAGVALATGFAPKLSVGEITGTCAHCRKAA